MVRPRSLSAVPVMTRLEGNSPSPHPADQGLLNLLDLAPIAMCLVVQRRIVRANAALETLLGHSGGALNGAILDTIACRPDTPLIGDARPQPLRHADGHPVWVVLRAGAGDRLGQVVWTIEDASELQALRQEAARIRGHIAAEIERKTVRVREANSDYRRELTRLRVFDVGLTQSREKYRVLFQNSQAGIAFVNDSGAISQTNPALRTMLRIRNMVEFRRMAQRPFCRCDGHDAPRSLAELARHLVQDKIGEQSLLFVFTMPEVEPRHIEMRCVRMHVRDYSAALTFTDRTEELFTQRRDAEQRRQLNRMGRISLAGHLGSAAAHELGQPLNVCMSYVGGLTQRLDNGEVETGQIRHALSKIEMELGRASAVLRNMRRFVANHQPEDRMVSFISLVHDTVEMMSSNLRDSNASVVLDLPNEDCLYFCGNSVEIQQVLVNLILNSLDAMREDSCERAQITITARIDPERRIECRLEDTGPGIAEDIRDHLFTPYRTGKADGLGLGLAMSRNIIESHGGYIWAEECTRRGATFCFTIPSLAGEAP